MALDPGTPILSGFKYARPGNPPATDLGRLERIRGLQVLVTFPTMMVVSAHPASLLLARKAMVGWQQIDTVDELFHELFRQQIAASPPKQS